MVKSIVVMVIIYATAAAAAATLLSPTVKVKAASLPMGIQRQQHRRRRRASSSEASRRRSWVLLLPPRGGSVEEEDENKESEAVVVAASSVAIKMKKKQQQTSKSRKKKKKKKNSVVDSNEQSKDDDDDEMMLLLPSTATTTTTAATAQKDAISRVMKGNDAASILGDGIRRRANILRKDTLPSSRSTTFYPSVEEEETRALDAALVSVGLSLGTAGTTEEDIMTITRKEEEAIIKEIENDNDEDITTTTMQRRQPPHRRRRIDEEKTTTVVASIASYFRRTHGGTHVVQVLLSLLASGSGVTCLLLPPFPSSSTSLLDHSPSSSAAATAAAAAGKTTSPPSSSKTLSNHILLSTLKYELMQRTLTLGMAKYASGLVGAIFIGAMQIPKLGLRNVRRHLELVASDDPVGRYLFYCSLLVVWMGWFTGVPGGGGGMRGYNARVRGTIVSIMNAASATAAASDATSSSSTPSSEKDNGSIVSRESAVTTQLLNTLLEQPPPWFLSRPWGGILPILILCPVLLREITSVILVASDVLSLVASSTKSKSVKLFLGTLLSSCRTIVDGSLRVLVTSDDDDDEERRDSVADSFRRQMALAVVVSRCSSVMELAVGGILFWDAIQSFWRFAFLSPVATTTTGTTSMLLSGARLPFKYVLGKMVCAHLYLNFLQSKKRRKVRAG